MGYIRLNSSIYKYFMPKGEGSLFVGIQCQIKGPVVEEEEQLELKAITQGASLLLRAVVLKVWFQTSISTCKLVRIATSWAPLRIRNYGECGPAVLINTASNLNVLV